MNFCQAYNLLEWLSLGLKIAALKTYKSVGQSIVLVLVLNVFLYNLNKVG